MGYLPGLRPELHLRLVDNPTDAVETIALHTVKTAEDMKRSFVSLRGDPERVGALRQRYGAMARGPLIGLSWTSKNTDKVLPDLKDWEPLLAWAPATFVTLQYWRHKA